VASGLGAGRRALRVAARERRRVRLHAQARAGSHRRVGARWRDDRRTVPDPLRGAQRSPRPRALRGRADEPLHHPPQGPALLRAGRPVRFSLPAPASGRRRRPPSARRAGRG
jgi:hypothetical protein